MPRSILLFFLLALRVQVAHCQKAIGDVIEVRGDWRVENATNALLAGEGVSAGALIKASAAKKADLLVVVLLNGVRLAASCEETPCSASLKIPDTYVDSSVSFQKVLDAVKFVLLSRHEAVGNAFGSASSRGLFDARAEGVFSLGDGHTILLTPGQFALPEGRYRLELADAASGRFLHGQDAEMKAQSAAVKVSVPGPGNYLLRFKDDLDNSILDVFAAVPAAENYPKIEKHFKQAKEVCAQWGAEARDSSHYFLRAYLLSLADQP